MQDVESWASAFEFYGMVLALEEETAAGWALTKTCINPVSVFRVFDLLCVQLKPYENEFSTALSERKAVARCATRKTDTAINRIKTVGAHKLRIENTYIVNRRKTLVAIGIGRYSPITPWHLRTYACIL